MGPVGAGARRLGDGVVARRPPDGVRRRGDGEPPRRRAGDEGPLGDRPPDHAGRLALERGGPPRPLGPGLGRGGPPRGEAAAAHPPRRQRAVDRVGAGRALDRLRHRTRTGRRHSAAALDLGRARRAAAPHARPSASPGTPGPRPSRPTGAGSPAAAWTSRTRWTTRSRGSSWLRSIPTGTARRLRSRWPRTSISPSATGTTRTSTAGWHRPGRGRRGTAPGRSSPWSARPAACSPGASAGIRMRGGRSAPPRA